jgi:methylmalonyl-CoA mutase N-terminal domain/subunit
MKHRFDAQNPRSITLRFHTQTCGVTLTAQQPDNNVVRVAYQALAAVLGGTNSLHTNSRDEALSLPTEEAVTLALRTQQIMAYETGIDSTIDPLAGSYFIESLTNKIEAEVMSYIQKIDQMGGALIATEQGYIQREIHDSAYEYQLNIEKKEQTVVGINRFISDEQPRWDILIVDPTVVLKRNEQLTILKNERDTGKVHHILTKLQKSAQTDSNLMPIIFEAVKAYITLGEICDALRAVWGEYEPVSFM